MPSNKDRLYVALHARAGRSKMPGGEDKYHWALLIGPKHEVAGESGKVRGKRIHAKERILDDGSGTSTWVYTEEEVNMKAVMMLLVRVQVAKCRDTEGVLAALRTVPLRGGKKPAWNCVAWVREALETLDGTGVLGRSAVLEWSRVRDASMAYAQKKAAEHRFDGKAKPGRFDTAKVPTYDLLRNREMIP
ncbi:hypothetical protein ACRE_081310 [Hapsidospora chrysogenum ATCC 11550]|uniref:Uncharacterized protein n=1 Tax=Hapsidospora chrysogenum (strain ATCC 11550 / CBS 779.69 / DSM 880 / IAM 14645 / JCM 23072 / IMI 49137) TaxID=857340 RepID=A0A086SVM0_HAPC1|nr:hypothetical protein ACRE_081310 [Hapsidospora chrysogenum ATCC 11550]